MESAASGFLVGGWETARRLQGKPPVDFPQETAIGALGLYVSNQSCDGVPAHEYQFRHYAAAGPSGQGQTEQECRAVPAVVDNH